MATPLDLAELRRDYTTRGLLESDVDPDPLIQFRRWLQEAVDHELMEPNAMTLATVDPDGRPWTRTVLLKGCDERGFVFFTNYAGAKARHLAHDPRCALTFWWAPHERQVNVTGKVSKVGSEETESYFNKRPLFSRLGAWASAQSEVIPNRQVLEQQFAEFQQRFGDHVPVPPQWGGFVVAAETVEFGQGRKSRLHDRLRYTVQEDGIWKIERLSP